MADAKRPVVEIVSANPAKRKRDSVEVISPVAQEKSDIHEAKRSKSSTPSQDRLLAPEVNIEHEASVKIQPAVDPSRVREAIESQLSLEILLKHSELRLINQEIAKCQTALDQLRRCHLIPYPISKGNPESMMGLVDGTGPALAQGTNVPRWAPSYGVADGPYTRHYAKWLIPDPRFDGVQVDWPRGLGESRAGKTVPEGRSTRHSIAEGAPASKGRAHRGSGSQKLQALSSGYAQPKDKAGPCILRRMKDGEMVKLVCPTCNRHDFSSTQGFINHCRIAHHLDYKSHEEAAINCGQVIEIDEVGGIVGEEKTPVVVSGLVHPLVRSAPISKDAYSAVMSRIQASMDMFKAGDPRVPSIPTSAAPPPAKTISSNSNPNFVASSSTPFLSSLMGKRGFDMDFDQIVGDARTKVDFDEEYESEDTESQSTPTQSTPTKQRPSALEASAYTPPMRVPARAGVSPAPNGRPLSSKGLSGISPRLAHATPVINTAAANSHPRPSRLMSSPINSSFTQHPEPDMDTEMLDGPSITYLSPNTVASNKPPSLVSDDGDFESEGESEREEDDDSDVAEIEVEDDGGLVKRTGGGEGLRIRKEEKKERDKGVTFVSPVKEKGGRGRNRS